MKAAVISAVAALALAGCTGHHGPAAIEDPLAIQALLDQRTDRQGAYEALGQPDMVSTNGGGETVWTWHRITSSSNALSMIPIVGIVAGGYDYDGTVGWLAFGADGLAANGGRDTFLVYRNSWAAFGDKFTPNHARAAVRAEMEAYHLPYDPEHARTGSVLADLLAIGE